MQVCYPEKIDLLLLQLLIDVKMKRPLECLEHYLKLEHKDVEIKECGLIRSFTFPYGATPDGLMSCLCCEKDCIIEIKCPFKCIQTTTVEHN